LLIVPKFVSDFQSEISFEKYASLNAVQFATLPRFANHDSIRFFAANRQTHFTSLLCRKSPLPRGSPHYQSDESNELDRLDM
jgi:hypothetical protein